MLVGYCFETYTCDSFELLFLDLDMDIALGYARWWVGHITDFTVDMDVSRPRHGYSSELCLLVVVIVLSYACWLFLGLISG